MSDTNGGQTVTLGGQQIPLALPPSPAMRLDVYFAAGTNLSRAACAALGVCWGDRVSRPRVSYARTKHDPLAYGGAVLDALLERGLSYLEILDAANEAFIVLEGSVRPLLGDLVGSEEVEETEDFSGVPAVAGSG